MTFKRLSLYDGIPAELCDAGLRLTEDIEIIYGGPTFGQTRIIGYRGDEWDGATIPRLFWPIVGHPLEPALALPSFIHDRKCAQAVEPHHRFLADAEFLFTLSYRGIPKWRRDLLWAGVRIYARTLWKPPEFPALTTMGDWSFREGSEGRGHGDAGNQAGDHSSFSGLLVPGKPEGSASSGSEAGGGKAAGAGCEKPSGWDDPDWD